MFFGNMTMNIYLFLFPACEASINELKHLPRSRVPALQKVR